MDAALIAEREAFKKKAMAVPTIENVKKRKREDEGTSKKASLSSWNKPEKKPSKNKFGTAGSQFKFGVLGEYNFTILCVNQVL